MKENLQKPIDQKHRLICQGKNLLNYLSRTDMKVMLDYAKVGAKLEGAQDNEDQEVREYGHATNIKIIKEILKHALASKQLIEEEKAEELEYEIDDFDVDGGQGQE